MAEPDFTNPLLTSDVIKQEPSPIPGPSCAPVERPLPLKEETPDAYDCYEDDDYSSLEGDSSIDPDVVPIPESQLPKPESNARYRTEKYEVKDLYAAAVDGRCPTNWPLANLWPVYVGNFRCGGPDQCYKAIRFYFASKGLLVRWFFQLNDDYFQHFQRAANLYDGLVYFGSEQDAVQALESDNSINNGYTLNVFPGRDPVYFPADRSAMFRNIRSGYVYSEEFFARALMARHGGIRCVVKYDIANGAAEFYSVAQTQKVFATERQFQPAPVGHQTLQKQRFVEADIREQILAGLARDPNALKMVEQDPLFLKLQSGSLPEPLRCSGPAKRQGGSGGSIQPVRRGPSKYSQKIKLNNKLRKMRRQIERDLAEGREPRPLHGGRSKADKQRFRQMCEQIKREQGW